jgi:hypothetical protein
MYLATWSWKGKILSFEMSGAGASALDPEVLDAVATSASMLALIDSAATSGADVSAAAARARGRG